MKSNKMNSKNRHRASTLFMLLFTAVTLAAEGAIEADTKGKSPIVLVHGAWQGPYVWDQAKAELESAGYRVNVVALPAHAEDNTPAYQVSMQGYVEIVKKAINSFDEPVILVGHSLGGAIITQAASEVPQKISKLVYIAGFIPQSGKSVLDYSQMDKGSLLGPSIRLSEDQTQAAIDQPSINLPRIFSQDATQQQKDFLVSRYKAEPTIPMGTPLHYEASQYKAAGEKFYIYTEADQTISYGLQQEMATAAGITHTFTINTGHSPFISRPADVVRILKKIAKK